MAYEATPVIIVLDDKDSHARLGVGTNDFASQWLKNAYSRLPEELLAEYHKGVFSLIIESTKTTHPDGDKYDYDSPDITVEIRFDRKNGVDDFRIHEIVFYIPKKSKTPNDSGSASNNPPPGGGGNNNPPPGGGGNNNPPPGGGGNNNPPPGGGGNNTPPPSGGGNNTPPPSGGGNNTPPPSGGGNNTPPPSGGGNNTPPPSGGGNNTPPPGGGSPTLTERDKRIIRNYADKEHDSGITDVESAWRNAAPSILGDTTIQCNDKNAIKAEFVGYWQWKQYDKPAQSSSSGGSQSSTPGGGGRTTTERDLDQLYAASLASLSAQGTPTINDLFNDIYQGLLDSGYPRDANTQRLVEDYLNGIYNPNSGASGIPGTPPGFSNPVLPNVAFDASGWGYGGDLDPSTMNVEPILGEPVSSSPMYEQSRRRSQAFAEWALSYRRYASNQYLNDLAKRMGIKANSYHFNDVRFAMGILDEMSPELQRFADARYRALDYLNMPQNERMLERAGLDAAGKTRSVGEIEASWWEIALPFSRYNREKKETRTQLQDALAQEADAKNDYLDARARGASQDQLDQRAEQLRFASARRRELEYDLQKLDEGYSHWDSPYRKDRRSLDSAYDVIKEIDQTFDPITGERTHNNDPSPELSSLLNARDSEDAASAFGKDRAERERWASQEAEQLKREREREKARQRKEAWGRKGEIIGTIAGGFLGGAVGAEIGGSVGKKAGEIAAGLTSSFGKLKTAADKLEETWRRFRNWIEETVNQAFSLAPYNGRIGAVKAWFQGQDYYRQIQRGQNLENSSVRVIEKWNELLNDTQNLRDAFIELKNVVKLVVLAFLDFIAKGANKATEWIKSVTGEEKGAWAWATALEFLTGVAALAAGIGVEIVTAGGGSALGFSLIGYGALATGGAIAGIFANHMSDDEWTNTKPGEPPKKRKQREKVRIRSRLGAVFTTEGDEESKIEQRLALGSAEVGLGVTTTLLSLASGTPTLGGLFGTGAIVAGTAAVADAGNDLRDYYVKVKRDRNNAFDYEGNAFWRNGEGLTQEEIEQKALDLGMIRIDDKGNPVYKLSGRISREGEETDHKKYEYDAGLYQAYLRAQGAAAREYYETGDVSDANYKEYAAICKQFHQDTSKEEFIELLKSEETRDFYEDAIAFNDIERGDNFYQGYRGLEDKPTTEQDLAKVLERIENGNLALERANKHLAMLTDNTQEIAENTRKEDEKEKNMLVDSPLVKAMEEISNRNRKIRDDFEKVDAGAPMGMKSIYGMSHQRANETLYGELAAARQRGVRASEK